MGVNDLDNKSSYANKYAELVSTYPKSNIIAVSVNPVVDSRSRNAKNSAIASFNTTISNKASSTSGLYYCNTYSKIKSNFSTKDGIHYTDETYKKIYKEMKKCAPIEDSTKTTSTTNSKTKKILFIGNSFTYRPGTASDPTIPKEVVAMAAKDGISLEYESVLKSSATLDSLWGNSSYKKKIRKSYDYVVIQPRSKTFIKSNSAYKDPSLQMNAGVAIAKALKEKNSKVKIYVRRIWGYDNQLSGFKEIYNGTTKIGNKIGNVVFIDDGNAFYDTLKNYKDLSIYKNDHYHQNINGAYLASLCIYAKIFNKDPNKIEYVTSGVKNENTLKTIAHNNCY